MILMTYKRLIDDFLVTCILFIQRVIPGGMGGECVGTVRMILPLSHTNPGKTQVIVTIIKLFHMISCHYMQTGI